MFHTEIKNAGRVLQLLLGARAVDHISVEEYEICKMIIHYLLENLNKREFTFAGLRSAIGLPEEKAFIFLQCASLLCDKKYRVFEVRYRIYDSAIGKVIQDLDSEQFLKVAAAGHFIDSDGNTIGVSLEDLGKRTFQHMVKKLGEVRPDFSCARI